MEVIDFAQTPSIIGQYMTELRDVNKQTDMLRFRANLERIGEIMAYEISKTMRYRMEEIETPLAPCMSPVLDEDVVLSTIFRAGVPFHKGFLNNSTIARMPLYRLTENTRKRRISMCS